MSSAAGTLFPATSAITSIKLTAGGGVGKRVKGVIVIACNGILRAGPEGDLSISE